MSTDLEIKEMIFDIQKIEKNILDVPQTVGTILKQCKRNGTYQMILRRKLSNLWKEGKISKIVIPGTRKGLVIFTGNEKDYSIIVENTRIGVNIFYFFKHTLRNKFAVELNDYWKLENDYWVKHEDEVVISKGSILKWI
jgi:hypothetical protein